MLKWPVVRVLKSSPVEQSYVEVVNTNMTRAINAALVLGKIDYLDQSARWLAGLLKNHELSTALSAQCFKAFQQAIQEQSDPRIELIPSWLVRFEKMSYPPPFGRIL